MWSGVVALMSFTRLWRDHLDRTPRPPVVFVFSGPNSWYSGKVSDKQAGILFTDKNHNAEKKEVINPNHTFSHSFQILSSPILEYFCILFLGIFILISSILLWKEEHPFLWFYLPVEKIMFQDVPIQFDERLMLNQILFSLQSYVVIIHRNMISKSRPVFSVASP